MPTAAHCRATSQGEDGSRAGMGSLTGRLRHTLTSGMHSAAAAHAARAELPEHEQANLVCSATQPRISMLRARVRCRAANAGPFSADCAAAADRLAHMYVAKRSISSPGGLLMSACMLNHFTGRDSAAGATPGTAQGLRQATSRVIQ